VKKIIIRLLIILFFFLHSNSVVSQNFEKNFKKQQEDMLKTILWHSSMLESKNIKISEEVLKAMQNVPRHEFVPH